MITQKREVKLKWSSCEILAKGTIAITGHGDYDSGKQADERDKDVIFKNCTPFRECISVINDQRYLCCDIDI